MTVHDCAWLCMTAKMCMLMHAHAMAISTCKQVKKNWWSTSGEVYVNVKWVEDQLDGPIALNVILYLRPERSRSHLVDTNLSSNFLSIIDLVSHLFWMPSHHHLLEPKNACSVYQMHFHRTQEPLVNIKNKIMHAPDRHYRLSKILTTGFRQSNWHQKNDCWSYSTQITMHSSPPPKKPQYSW